jgi:putative spermidine/putrescine transport system permease protein
MRKNKFDAAVIIMICAYLALPLLIALIYSISGSWAGILPSGFTSRHYLALLNDKRFVMALIRTIALCAAPIVLAIFVILLALFAVILHYPRFEKYIQLLCMIPYALQGIILSISVISIYAGRASFMGHRAVMLSGAYCILILPYVYQGLRNAFYAINAKILIETASTFGASELYSFIHVIVPNLAPGIIMVFLLSMSILVGDFVTINTIAGSNFENVQMYLFKIMSYSSGQSSAIFIVIFLMISLITALGLFVQNKIIKNWGR